MHTASPVAETDLMGAAVLSCMHPLKRAIKNDCLIRDSMC